MPPRVRWTVSQATGAWIDAGGITGSAGEAAAARGMLERVAAQLSASAPALTLLAREGAYSLLPHVPASSSPLPFAAAARVDGRSLFRLSGGAEAEGEDVSTLRVLGADAVLDALVPDNGATLARFGHHLLPSSSATPTLAPPIQGGPLAPGSPLAQLSGTVFSPAMPPALLRFPLPERTRRRRRVTYALPGGRLVAEATYPLREVRAQKKPGHEPHWTELLDQQLKGGDVFAPGVDAGKDALDRFFAEEDEEDDLVDEILGASSGDIDRLIDGGAKPPSPEGSEALQSESAAAAEGPAVGAVGSDDKSAKAMLDVAARLERNEVLTDVALPWKPVDVRFVSRATEATAIPPALAEFFARAAESAEYVMGLALDDVAGLRRGAPPPAPTAPAEEKDADTAADTDAIPPAPLGTAAPPPELTPPPTLRIGDETATLLADEILDVAESVRPHGTGPKPTLRTVSAVDLASPGAVTQYAELDGEGLWDEIGSVARAVGR